jgi:hypothetical protein
MSADWLTVVTLTVVLLTVLLSMTLLSGRSTAVDERIRVMVLLSRVDSRCAARRSLVRDESLWHAGKAVI